MFQMTSAGWLYNFIKITGSQKHRLVVFVSSLWSNDILHVQYRRVFRCKNNKYIFFYFSRLAWAVTILRRDTHILLCLCQPPSTRNSWSEFRATNGPNHLLLMPLEPWVASAVWAMILGLNTGLVYALRLSDLVTGI